MSAAKGKRLPKTRELQMGMKQISETQCRLYNAKSQLRAVTALAKELNNVVALDIRTALTLATDEIEAIADSLGDHIGYEPLQPERKGGAT